MTTINDSTIAVLIYGAAGYTGKLLAQHLIQQGIQPILGGRNEELRTLGTELNCPVAIFTTKEATAALADVDILVNLAGPFKYTQSDLIEACIASKTHYLDIAGEVPEVKAAATYQAAAQAAGIVVLPAAGFGVVPTEIAAILAAQQITAPTHLSIAYATEGGASRGTLKTVLSDINKEGIVVEQGQAKSAKPAKSSKKFEVFGKSFKAVYNPWRADLYTAHQSTGIPNVETYSVFPGFVVSMMKGRLNWLRNLILQRLLRYFPEGPTQKQLDKGRTYVHAQVSNAQGKQATVSLEGPEAYQFTILSLTAALKEVMNSKKKGVLAPSELGTAWLKNITGVRIKIS